MVRILIIDKQRSVRNTLRENLEHQRYTVETAESLEEAYDLFSKLPFGIVLAPDQIFEEHITAGNSIMDAALFIVTSLNPSVEEAVKALRSGAYDYVSKPRDMNAILVAVKNAVDELEVDNNAVASIRSTPRTKAKRGTKPVEEIIGVSPQITKVKVLIEKVAPSDARVLVTGPNGTGKELVAKWIHAMSNRCDAPFVEVNCAAIPSELIESELFGHEKGAFTSAVKQHKGKFEIANGGTLFLDEIGDMSLSAQAKVLRALQENRICRVGSGKDLEVDVRIVAATNKNLREEILKGNFREDLYHRLSVIVINVPPLVDRLEDLPLLVDYFVHQISTEYGKTKDIRNDAVEELKTKDWTGNIRELRNVIERLIILSDDEITCDDVRKYVVETS